MKLSPPAESLINLSIQNFTPFPVWSLFPSSWGVSKKKKKRKNWSQARPRKALPSSKNPPFELSPISELHGAGEGFNLLGPSCVPKNQDQNQRVPSSSRRERDNHLMHMCQLFWGQLTPTQEEGGGYMLTTSTEIPDWLESDGWDLQNITLLHHHQPIRRWPTSWSCILWLSPNIVFKNSCLKAIGAFGSFEHSPDWCPTIKLSLCYKHPLSEFGFLCIQDLN